MDDEYRRKVDKHDRDLYQGNGMPALTVRMALAERDIETDRATAKKEIKDVKDTVDEIKADNKAMKRMLIGAILALIGEIVVTLFAKWVH